jgi:hypothetical protein
MLGTNMQTLIVCIGVSVAVGLSLARAAQQPSQSETVDVCDLQRNPAGHDHQEIQVSGIVTHGFENFSLSDSRCPSLGVWLEYGGTVNSETTYCCGHAPGSRRAETLTVEGIALPLVDDALFRQFDDRIRKAAANDVTFGAALVGHFFAGKKTQRPDGVAYWAGYGHLGCCSLLVIQRVVAVRD